MDVLRMSVLIFAAFVFTVWQILPLVRSKIALKEKLSILKSRDNPPGVNGKPVILKNNLKLRIREDVRKGWEEHAFNRFVSDLIPVNRTLPDSRDLWCKHRVYSKLPKATVVICFHNEAWSTLLRTFHSVLNRSPGDVLDEVILVDDYSTMEHLKKPLETYIKSIPKVKLIRTDRREGLIRARILGTNHVKSPVAVFLDSHCECKEGWLEPLLQRVSEDPTRVVSPVIDHIHVSTFEYIAQDVHELRIGGFTWDLKFNWIVIPQEALIKRKHDASPVQSPTISGGLFAIDTIYFEKMGYYDGQFDIWGAENLELSFKTWMCGGSVEIIPCSHVGHIFRYRFPYEGQKGSVKRNNVRLAEVWLDDYAKYFYERIGHNKGNFGKVVKRKNLRQKLHCKNFKWYLETIYPQMIVPKNRIASGQIVSLNYVDWCLDSDTRLKTLRDSVNLILCHHQGGNQFWAYTESGEIRRDGMCLDYMFRNVILFICRGKASSQVWLYYNEIKSLKHMETKQCLAATKQKEKYKIVLQHCINAYSQKWLMENFVIKRLSPTLLNYSSYVNKE